MGDPSRPAGVEPVGPGAAGASPDGAGEPAAPGASSEPGTVLGGTVDADANVVLIGFMGAGKSEVGRRLARRLNRPFLDADVIIEARAGRSIPDLFRAEGERGFRRQEARIIAELGKVRGSVIATGGGAVVDPTNWDALSAGGIMVWLEAPLDVLLARVGAGAETDRPMLARSRDELEALYDARRTVYARAHLTINTAERTPDQVVDAIVAALGTGVEAAPLRLDEPGEPVPPAGEGPAAVGEPGSRGRLQTVHVPLGDRTYPIWIGPGLRAHMGSLLSRLGIGRRLLVVTQPALERLYAGEVMASLDAAGFQCRLAVIPDGEAHKTLATVARLYDEAIAAGLDRTSAMVALGGGVLGDIVGMAAATFMRGIDLVQVPTTLLAQVDSAVGGKVGVNLPQGKNLVGAFHQPRAVVADTQTLLSLPDRELLAGLAEVVKYGFIADPQLLERLEDRAEALLARDLDELAFCVRRSCEIKADIVRQDEREAGVRAWLNFGHTFGHGIEAAGGYRRHLHGEAVAIGMAAALRLSRDVGLLDPGDVARGEGLMARLGLPLQAEGIDPGAAWEAMGRDKKAREGRLRLVLLEGFGRPVVRGDVDPELVRRALWSVCSPGAAPGAASSGVASSGAAFSGTSAGAASSTEGSGVRP